VSDNRRDEIGELVHRYSDAVTRRDGVQWSSCWADDASWALSPARAVSGRDEIVQLWRAAMAGMEGVVHNVLHGAVSVDGATATGQWYISEHYRRVSGEAGLLLARYDDTYVKQDGRWLFASRTLVPSYQGPPDLSGTFSKPAGFSDKEEKK
jgi:ketosteroid isomerase-like protein